MTHEICDTTVFTSMVGIFISGLCCHNSLLPVDIEIHPGTSSEKIFYRDSQNRASPELIHFTGYNEQGTITLPFMSLVTCRHWNPEPPVMAHEDCTVDGLWRMTADIIWQQLTIGYDHAGIFDCCVLDMFISICMLELLANNNKNHHQTTVEFN